MLELLYKRRSIRQYKDIPVEEEKVKEIIQAGLLAPSARNARSPRLIVVNDKAVLQKLSLARQNGSSFIGGAALAVVVAGDSTLIDVWTEDCTIAATLMIVTAQSLGLGSCWVQIRNRMHDDSTTSNDYIQELLDLPKGFQVQCIIPLGYPDEEKRARTPEDVKHDRVFYNKFS